MVSIVEDVAVAASLVATAAVTTTKPSQSNDSNNNETARAPSSSATATSTLARRLDVGLAVSQAFDVTLVHLARELRGRIGTSTSMGQGLRGSNGSSSGRHERSSLSCSSRPRRRPLAMAQSQQSAAIARASGAGLYFDAYETVVACLLRTFSYLAEGSPAEYQDKLGSSPRSFSNGDGEPPRSDQQQPFGERRRGSKCSSDTGAPIGVQKSGREFDAWSRPTTMSETMVEKGVMPRGWDAEARRNAWTQRKLEVLGMSLCLTVVCFCIRQA